MSYTQKIARQLKLRPKNVENTISLLEEGATIPFIARYRKEMTGSLDEVQITDIRDLLHKLGELDKRRETILNPRTWSWTPRRHPHAATR